MSYPSKHTGRSHLHSRPCRGQVLPPPPDLHSHNKPLDNVPSPDKRALRRWRRCGSKLELTPSCFLDISPSSLVRSQYLYQRRQARFCIPCVSIFVVCTRDHHISIIITASSAHSYPRSFPATPDTLRVLLFSLFFNASGHEFQPRYFPL